MEQATPFKLLAGHLALDFANTLDDRYSPSGPIELLDNYEGWLRFCVQARGLTEAEAQSLSSHAEKPNATAVLCSAIELREAIERIFSAIAKQRHVSPPDLAILNRHLGTALLHRKVAPKREAFEWHWEGLETFPSGPEWPIAYAAAELLTSPERELVRQCDRETCRWLFLDHSKNHSRRWCDMQVCGNRTKARRYYKKRTGSLTLS
jgi:predicted RNA-binding Zn ribbon-like protein